jgi:hypothetical protein
MDAFAAPSAVASPQSAPQFLSRADIEKALIETEGLFGSPSPIKPHRIGGRIHSRLRVRIMAAACIFFAWLIQPSSMNENGLDE